MRKVMSNCQVLILAATIVVLGGGGVQAEDATIEDAWYTFPRTPEFVVVEFISAGGLFGEEASLRILGTGHVQVFHSDAWNGREPGRYEMELSEARLEEILHTLIRYRIMDYDERQVRNKLHEARLRLVAENRPLPGSTDSPILQIAIALEEYRSAEQPEGVSNLRKTIQWEDVESVAEWSEVEEIAGFVEAAAHLAELMEDEHLQPSSSESAQDAPH